MQKQTIAAHSRLTAHTAYSFWACRARTGLPVHHSSSSCCQVRCWVQQVGGAHDSSMLCPRLGLCLELQAAVAVTCVSALQQAVLVVQRVAGNQGMCETRHIMCSGCCGIYSMPYILLRSCAVLCYAGVATVSDAVTATAWAEKPLSGKAGWGLGLYCQPDQDGLELGMALGTPSAANQHMSRCGVQVNGCVVCLGLDGCNQQ
jgi:hypothetical protein